MSDYKAQEQQIAEGALKWSGMPKGTPEEETSAKEFYMKEVFMPSRALFKRKEGQKFLDIKIYGLILTVGYSWEPLVLTISVCQPQKVFFLYSDDTEPFLDKIVDITRLRPSQFDKQKVKKDDSLLIYKQVLRMYEYWGRDKRLAADITGGTKAMTGALSMAGALLGIELLYVNNKEYDQEHRRPRPGTEYLVTIKNPYSVFGVLQENEVKELFRRKDYHGAGMLLADLVGKVPDSRKFEVLLYLSRAYEGWESLNLKEAAANLEVTHQKLKKAYEAAPGLLPAEVGLLAAQVASLQHLGGLMPAKPADSTLPLLKDLAAVETLIFTVYQIAIRMAERGKYDTASLYLYRSLEIFEQRRLAFHGIDTANPDYALLLETLPDETNETLLVKYNKVKKELKQDLVKHLPRQISLLDGYILLEAIDDPFQLKKVSPHPVNWSRFINENQKRNHSILAHGFVFVPEAQFNYFKAMVDDIFNLFCEVEQTDRGVCGLQYRFIEDPFNNKMLDCF